MMLSKEVREISKKVNIKWEPFKVKNGVSAEKDVWCILTEEYDFWLYGPKSNYSRYGHYGEGRGKKYTLCMARNDATGITSKDRKFRSFDKFEDSIPSMIQLLNEEEDYNYTYTREL